MDDFDEVGTGATDFDGDDVIIVRHVGGEAAMVPRSLQGLPGPAQVIVTEVMRSAAAVHQAQADLAEFVAEAREHGVSWAGIGWAVGTTGESARQRWGNATS
jgi:hypothetical protein